LIPKYCLDVVKTCFPQSDVKFNYLEDEIKDNEFFLKRFHQVQKKIVNFSLQKTLPVTLIQGPPGTGKSTVIKEMIFQSLKKGEKILVTAFSNAGCDNLANITSLLQLESLSNFSKEQFLRIGNSSRMKPGVKEISLDERENKSFFKICLNKIEKTKYNKEDKVLVSERQHELEAKLNTFREVLIDKAGVIFSTCVSSGSFAMRKFIENKKNFFDLVIIDEASQALEAACWIPMLLGKKVVIVGDFKQIGPIVNTNKLFTFTLFEKLYEIYSDDISRMLTVQFRMHEKIMRFPSKYFYKGLLEADSSVSDRTLYDMLKVKDPLDIFKEPLIMINTCGESEEDKISTTKYNKGEADIVLWFIRYLTKYGVSQSDIGVITPYSGQVNYLKCNIEGPIDISTVDAFQGSEKEVIIMSFVRSNNRREIGFLGDKRRINVSLTRPKKMLVLICDGSTLNTNSFLKDVFQFYDKNSKVLDKDIIENNY
jgi:ATP-dependent RNA/DNA helicase IGHMBP2